MLRPLRLAAFTLVFTGLSLAGASWFGGARLQDLKVLSQSLLWEYERSEMLERHNETTRRCREGKRGVTEALIAGRTGLLEAAAEYRDLHAPLGDGYDPVFGTCRPLYDEELCEIVLQVVRSRLRGGDGTSVLSRLQDEYREHFHKEPPPWLLVSTP